MDKKETVQWAGMKKKFKTKKALSEHMAKIARDHHKKLGHKISKKK